MYFLPSIWVEICVQDWSVVSPYVIHTKSASLLTTYLIPEHWEAPTEQELQSRSHEAKIAERNNIFQEMKHLQLQKLNRATYRFAYAYARTVGQDHYFCSPHFATHATTFRGSCGIPVSF